LFDGKIWILCLRDGRDEHIQTARIDYRFPDLAKLSIHSLRISPAQLRHATDSEQLKIFEHRRTDGHQIFELTSFGLHADTPISAVALAVARRSQSGRPALSRQLLSRHRMFRAVPAQSLRLAA